MEIFLDISISWLALPQMPDGSTHWPIVEQGNPENEDRGRVHCRLCIYFGCTGQFVLASGCTTGKKGSLVQHQVRCTCLPACHVCICAWLPTACVHVCVCAFLLASVHVYIRACILTWLPAASLK